MGAAYWRGFLALLEDMVKAGTVSATDLKLFLVTDHLDEALEHIRKHAIEEFKLLKTPRPKPSRLLGEGKDTPPRVPSAPAPSE
jgi:predicted Rossmann-fold nucleotide-binding protein